MSLKITCFCQLYLAGTAVSTVAACLQDAGRVCGSEFAKPGEGFVVRKTEAVIFAVVMRQHMAV